MNRDDDYIKQHEKFVLLFDEEWQKNQRANNPKLVKELLLECFRRDKKHKRARILIEEVCNRKFRTDNFYIARRLWKDGIKKLSKNEYQKTKNKYYERIKNLCNKTVRRLIRSTGYSISVYPLFTEIVKLA